MNGPANCRQSEHMLPPALVRGSNHPGQSDTFAGASRLRTRRLLRPKRPVFLFHLCITVMLWHYLRSIRVRGKAACVRGPAKLDSIKYGSASRGYCRYMRSPTLLSFSSQPLASSLLARFLRCVRHFCTNLSPSRQLLTLEMGKAGLACLMGLLTVVAGDRLPGK